MSRHVEITAAQLASGEIGGKIRSTLLDTRGTLAIVDALATLSGTEFSDVELRRILTPPGPFEDWRVGEAAAEAYLMDESACTFPWRQRRDQKNPKASPAGVDLVGFVKEGDTVSFAFAEVKTPLVSATLKSAMSGSSGLISQLKRVLNDLGLRSSLITYLGHRAVNAPWLPDFQAALARFFRSPHRILVSGVVVRESNQDGGAIETGLAAIEKHRNPETRLELHRLIFPLGSLAGIGQAASVGGP